MSTSVESMTAMPPSPSRERPEGLDESPTKRARLDKGKETQKGQEGGEGSAVAAAATSVTQRVLLPTIVTPKTYDLHLKPDLENFIFYGEAAIDVVFHEPTNKITVHAKELDVQAAIVEMPGPGQTSGDEKVGADEIITFEAQTVEFDADNETATFTFAKSLFPRAGATLRVHYTGTLNDQMAGFYRATYGENKVMATTQFEATDARRAFPCWDEPAHKARFTVTLTIPSVLEALSNMPVKSTEDSVEGAGLKTVTFEESPVMSTYLLAFCVGEFDHIEATTAEGVMLRVYTVRGEQPAERGRFALDIGEKALSYYAEYFAEPFPLPKQDMIAIPDFAAGAMENWGLITYRETALLIDETTSSLAQKQRVAEVVAHELAHQWTGNLITMGWWTDLWLNEGFATFMAAQCVDNYFPQWQTWTQFVTAYMSRALYEDALPGTHPVEVEIAHSKNVDEIFDAISYMKGASVIRMIAAHIGPENMREGLRTYVQRHKYKNATTADLWAALSEASGTDVAEIMGAWTSQTGYPVLSIGGSPTSLRIDQQRFTMPFQENGGGECKTKWPIRVAFTGDKGVETTFDVPPKSVSIQDLRIAAIEHAQPTWLKANAGQVGFFRVLYTDEDMLDALCKAVEAQTMTNPIDRLGFQGDAFALARAGFMPTRNALLVAAAYGPGEKNPSVWIDLTNNLNTVLSVFGITPEMCEFIVRLYAPIYSAVDTTPTDDEPENTALLRAAVFGMLGRIGHEPAVTAAHEMFARYKAGESVPGDLQLPMFTTVLRHPPSTQMEDLNIGAEYEYIRDVFRKAQMHEEKIRALRALGCVRDSYLRIETLRWMTTSGEVRKGDMFYAFVSVASEDPQQGWTFVCEHWDDIKATFEGSSFHLGRIVLSCTRGLSGAHIDQVRSFFEEHPCDGIERSVRQGLDTIASNQAWRDRDATNLF